MIRFYLVICHEAVPDKNEPAGIVHDHLIVGGKDKGDFFLLVHLLHHFQQTGAGLGI